MIRKNEILIMGGASYIAPSMSVVDIHNEGLLCQSGLYDRADADYGFKDLGEI